MNGALLNDEYVKSGLRPDPVITVTDWADAHRYLPRKSSAEPGKYSTARTPYLREIMDCLSSTSSVQEICCMKGTQVGFTEAGNNWFGYVADVSPGPMMMVFPTVELAKDHSKQKMAPTIEETPRLRDKIRESKTRDSGNTIQAKEFPGGIVFLTGSNSAAGFRSKSIRYLFLDDVDGYEADVGGEGDPCNLARKRTDTFGSRRKIFEVSTPTIKGVSRIEAAFSESDQRYYYMPCPLCGHMQTLEWGGPDADFGIKFTRDENGNVTEVWYQCLKCHGRIDEHHKTAMLDQGEWIATNPEKRKRGYHLSGLYSPVGWVSWRQIVEEFLEAKGNQERLKVWTNTRLGLPFEDSGERPEWATLAARCEPYNILAIPEGGLFLTAGVDVQDNRLAVTIKAWGRGEESWLVYWGELYGDPGQNAVWDQLDRLLERAYSHEAGVDLHITCMAVDTGGHHTQAVYNYCRNRRQRCMAVKGASQPGKPVLGRPSLQDVNYKGKLIKNGVQLWPVGTDVAKGILYNRLNIGRTGNVYSCPGLMHFPIGIEDEYFMQLTAEKLITRHDRNGFPKKEWVKTRERNEGLDCEVYAYAAAVHAGISRMNWDEIEKTFKDSISKTTTPPEQRKKKPRPVIRSKFLS